MQIDSYQRQAVTCWRTKKLTRRKTILSKPAPIFKTSTNCLSKLFLTFMILMSRVSFVILTSLYTFPKRENRASLLTFPESYIESNGITDIKSMMNQLLRYLAAIC